MHARGMSISKLLLSACVLSLAACNEYYTPSSTSLPMTDGPSGAARGSSRARPTVRFPARVAVARIEKHYSGFVLDSGGNSEDPAHAAKAAALPGVKALVPMNRVALTTSVNSYDQLDREALKLGADLLAVYRFETETSHNDALFPITIATLGIAPSVGYKTTSVATLIVRDARTGYIYGVMEERATSKGVSPGMMLDTTENDAKRTTRKKAMDQLMDRLPGFWNGVVAKGR